MSTAHERSDVDWYADYIRWIVQVATDSGSLVFVWRGSCGDQPILMSGASYYWWLDDPEQTATLYATRQDDGGDRSRPD